MTAQQKFELDNIEEKILTILFGSVNIPETTAIALRIAKVNPNIYINKLESILLPIMQENGKINGILLKKLLMMSKYREIISYFVIPDSDFLLSDIVNDVVGKIIPGVTHV